MSRERPLVDRLVLAALVLAGCSAAAPPAEPLYPPGPSIIARRMLAHGQVGLAAAYRHDSLEAIEAVKPSGNERDDWFARAAAQSEVDERWLPVWRAWHRLKAAQRIYEDAGSREATPSDAELAAALCALRAAVPARWKAAVLPAMSEVCPSAHGSTAASGREH